MTAAGRDQSTVEELNEALRHYRRMLFRMFAIVILGLAGCWVLSLISGWLNPPYGVYIFGESLATWGLIAVVVLLLAEVWWEGRTIARILDDPALKSMPVLSVTTGLTVIARRAHAMGMTWTGFLGDLRPARKR